MKNKVRANFIICACIFIIFIIFTLLAALVDKAPIGPEGSSVGLSTVNGAVFNCFGTSEVWYTVTELLGVLALATALGAALLGLHQLVKRKRILSVDKDILLLAGLYAAVALAYVFFEVFTLNFRPVLVDGVLEASYPSSHTMLFYTVIGSVPVLVKRRFGNKRRLLTALNIVVALLCTVMAVGRLLSGMHWLTDIVAGVLLSAFLITLYISILSLLDFKAASKG